MNLSTDCAPLVSIVMLSYNRVQDVLNGLRQLQAISYSPLECIVVDNASSDGTPAAVSRLFPHVKLIALKENIGVAAANQGFFSAAGEYIVIIDDDSFPMADSISRMVKCFERDEKVGIVAFNVRNVAHFSQAQDYQVITENASELRLGFNGAGAGFRRSVLEQAGGYSEAFFLYWNELDLALRVLKAGYTICWDEKIIALHQYSPQNRDSLRAPFYYTRNLFWVYWQYWPLPLLIVRVLSLLFSCVYHSLEQRSAVYIKACLDALRHLSRIKRNPLSKQLVRSLRLTEKLAFIYFR